MTTPDPSPTPLPGSPAGYTQLNDSRIQIPVGATDLNPLEQPFQMYANSVLAEIQKLLRRMRSQKLFVNQNAFVPVNAWSDVDGFDQKVRIIGEVWAYMAITLSCDNGMTVPKQGDFPTTIIGNLQDEALYPRSLARLWSVQNGRLAAGHVISDGSVRLDAVNTASDIQPGEIISLAGMWPLLNGYDSESD